MTEFDKDFSLLAKKQKVRKHVGVTVIAEDLIEDIKNAWGGGVRTTVNLMSEENVFLSDLSGKVFVERFTKKVLRAESLRLIWKTLENVRFYY